MFSYRFSSTSLFFQAYPPFQLSNHMQCMYMLTPQTEPLHKLRALRESLRRMETSSLQRVADILQQGTEHRGTVMVIKIRQEKESGREWVNPLGFLRPSKSIYPKDMGTGSGGHQSAIDHITVLSPALQSI